MNYDFYTKRVSFVTFDISFHFISQSDDYRAVPVSIMHQVFLEVVGTNMSMLPSSNAPNGESN